MRPTISVLIRPVSTISTTRTSSAPVIRWPSANSDLRPIFSSVLVISGPPPWTITGRSPADCSSTISSAKLRLSAGSIIAAPPYLMTAALAGELADVAERLDDHRPVDPARRALAVSGLDAVLAPRVVLGVDLHVVERQVAAERARRRLAEPEIHPGGDLRLPHAGREIVLVERHRPAVSVDADPLDVQRDAGRIDRRTRARRSARPARPGSAPTTDRRRRCPDFTRLPPATARARSRAISRSGTPGDVDDRAACWPPRRRRRWPGPGRRRGWSASLPGS